HHDFHRAVVNIGDGGSAGDDFADVNWMFKSHRVHGDSDSWFLSVTHGGDGCCLVRKFHDDSTVNIAKMIGVLRHHERIEHNLALRRGFFGLFHNRKVTRVEEAPVAQLSPLCDSVPSASPWISSTSSF